jgi:hypothetical protein
VNLVDFLILTDMCSFVQLECVLIFLFCLVYDEKALFIHFAKLGFSEKLDYLGFRGPTFLKKSRQKTFQETSSL